jgi:hypothetical protein
MPEPIYESAPVTEGDVTFEHTWLVIGDLKFELDKETFTDPTVEKERLASKVLRHLVKERSKAHSAS